MSHTQKCGCVIADQKDSAVRKGFEVGGYIKQFCDQHNPRPSECVNMKPGFYIGARYRYQPDGEIDKEWIKVLSGRFESSRQAFSQVQRFKHDHPGAAELLVISVPNET